MIKKTLYIGNPAYLSVKNKQLVIKDPSVENSQTIPGRVKQKWEQTRPIEDIGFLIIDNKQVTITSSVLSELIDNNSVIITCNEKSMPTGMFLPFEGNTVQNERFSLQINSSLPLKKQLWQQTVQQKILNQCSILEKHTTEETNCMRIWASEVKSGDVDNMEARAAAFYWKTLMKSRIPDFVRGRDGDSPNDLLNYGYAILRAVMARALVSSGLLPTIGIHHHNRYNAFCLADDVMEPYRPYVDELVIGIIEKFGHSIGLTKEVKSILLTIPTVEVCLLNQKCPLMIAASQTTASLMKCFGNEIRKIKYPQMQL